MILWTVFCIASGVTLNCYNILLNISVAYFLEDSELVSEYILPLAGNLDVPSLMLAGLPNHQNWI